MIFLSIFLGILAGITACGFVILHYDRVARIEERARQHTMLVDGHEQMLRALALKCACVLNASVQDVLQDAVCEQASVFFDYRHCLHLIKTGEWMGGKDKEWLEK